MGSFPGPRSSLQNPRPLMWRLPLSVLLIAFILTLSLQLRHVDHATVGLMLVLAIVLLAIRWGWIEALTAAVIAALGFDYYFLPPRGLAIASPEHWIAMVAFIVTAVITSQVAAQIDRGRIGAIEKQNEIGRLYLLVNALLERDSAESTIVQIAGSVAEIFGFDGVAVYDSHTGEVVRSGSQAGKIQDQALREAAKSGQPVKVPASGLSLVPIRHGGELVGSIGVCGVKVSDDLLNAVAGRVGLGLARLYAKKSTQAEVVRRSEELKSAVLDAMAHDIRNPLNSIRLAVTTLLSKRALDPSRRQEMLEIIDEETIRMDGFLDEAVRLSRLEADHVAVKKEPEDIGRLIPAAIAEVGALAGNRPIEVCVPDTLPAAECDKELIARVLRQLVSNAFKYSPGDSPLTIAASFTGTDIVIDVVDRGPGVDEEERDRIFEKYYRGRAARTGTDGTGLGLASAKAIVQAHGGRIWVTTPPAGGAAFHVSLPVDGSYDRAGAF